MTSYLDWKVGDKISLINQELLQTHRYVRGEIIPIENKEYTIRTISTFNREKQPIVILRLEEIVNNEFDYYGEGKK